MKADWRISIKHYRRSKNLKIQITSGLKNYTAGFGSAAFTPLQCRLPYHVEAA